MSLAHVVVGRNTKTATERRWMFDLEQFILKAKGISEEIVDLGDHL